jgi:hypothetical protein
MSQNNRSYLPSYLPSHEENVEAMEASGKVVTAFAQEIEVMAPENLPLYNSVRGWLVAMYERGWHDAHHKGK